MSSSAAAPTSTAHQPAHSDTVPGALDAAATGAWVSAWLPVPAAPASIESGGGGASDHDAEMHEPAAAGAAPSAAVSRKRKLLSFTLPAPPGDAAGVVQQRHRALCAAAGQAVFESSEQQQQQQQLDDSASADDAPGASAPVTLRRASSRSKKAAALRGGNGNSVGGNKKARTSKSSASPSPSNSPSPIPLSAAPAAVSPAAAGGVSDSATRRRPAPPPYSTYLSEDAAALRKITPPQLDLLSPAIYYASPAEAIAMTDAAVTAYAAATATNAAIAAPTTAASSTAASSTSTSVRISSSRNPYPPRYSRRVWQSMPSRELFSPAQLALWMAANERQECEERTGVLNARREDAKRAAAALAQGKVPPPPMSAAPPPISWTPMLDKLREQHLSLAMPCRVGNPPVVPGGTIFRSGSGLDSLLHQNAVAHAQHAQLTKHFNARMEAFATAKAAQTTAAQAAAAAGMPLAPQPALPPLPAPLPPPPAADYSKISFWIHLYQHGFALHGTNPPANNSGANAASNSALAQDSQQANFHLYSAHTAPFLRDIDHGLIPAMLATLLQPHTNVVPTSTEQATAAATAATSAAAASGAHAAAGAAATAALGAAPAGSLAPFALHYFDGHLLCELRDYRSLTPSMRGPIIRRMLLRPSQEALQTDALLLVLDHAEALSNSAHQSAVAAAAAAVAAAPPAQTIKAEPTGTGVTPDAIAGAAGAPPSNSASLVSTAASPIAGAADPVSSRFRSLVFSAEALLLRLTRRQLCLDPSPRVMQVANLAHYSGGRAFVPPLRKKEAKRRAMEIIASLGEAATEEPTMPLPLERKQSIAATPLSNGVLKRSSDVFPELLPFDAEQLDALSKPVAPAATATNGLAGRSWFEYDVEVDPLMMPPSTAAELGLPPSPLQSEVELSPAEKLKHFQQLRTFLRTKTLALRAPPTTAAAITSMKSSPQQAKPNARVKRERVSAAASTVVKRESVEEDERKDLAVPASAAAAASTSSFAAMDTSGAGDDSTERKEAVSEHEEDEEMGAAEMRQPFTFAMQTGVGEEPCLECFGSDVDSNKQKTDGAAIADGDNTAALPSPAEIDSQVTRAVLAYSSFAFHCVPGLASAALNATLTDPVLRNSVLSGRGYALTQGLPAATIGAPGGEPLPPEVVAEQEQQKRPQVLTHVPAGNPFVPSASVATLPYPPLPLPPPVPPPTAAGAAATNTKRPVVHISSSFPKVAPGDRPAAAATAAIAAASSISNAVGSRPPAAPLTTVPSGPRPNEWVGHMYSPLSAGSIAATAAHASASNSSNNIALKDAKQIHELLLRALPAAPPPGTAGASSAISAPLFSGQYEASLRQWALDGRGSGNATAEVRSWIVGNEGARDRFLAQWRRDEEREGRSLMATQICVQQNPPTFQLPPGWFADEQLGTWLRVSSQATLSSSSNAAALAARNASTASAAQAAAAAAAVAASATNANVSSAAQGAATALQLQQQHAQQQGAPTGAYRSQTVGITSSSRAGPLPSSSGGANVGPMGAPPQQLSYPPQASRGVYSNTSTLPPNVRPQSLATAGGASGIGGVGVGGGYPSGPTQQQQQQQQQMGLGPALAQGLARSSTGMSMQQQQQPNYSTGHNYSMTPGGGGGSYAGTGYPQSQYSGAGGGGTANAPLSSYPNGPSRQSGGGGAYGGNANYGNAATASGSNMSGQQQMMRQMSNSSAASMQQQQQQQQQMQQHLAAQQQAQMRYAASGGGAGQMQQSSAPPPLHSRQSSSSSMFSQQPGSGTGSGGQQSAYMTSQGGSGTPAQSSRALGGGAGSSAGYASSNTGNNTPRTPQQQQQPQQYQLYSSTPPHLSRQLSSGSAGTNTPTSIAQGSGSGFWTDPNAAGQQRQQQQQQFQQQQQPSGSSNASMRQQQQMLASSQQQLVQLQQQIQAQASRFTSGSGGGGGGGGGAPASPFSVGSFGSPSPSHHQQQQQLANMYANASAAAAAAAAVNAAAAASSSSSSSGVGGARGGGYGQQQQQAPNAQQQQQIQQRGPQQQQQPQQQYASYPTTNKPQQQQQ